jgi:hypothetical protein
MASARAKKKRPRFIVETRSSKGLTYELERVCCGKPKCRKCSGGRPSHGPYWYAYWKEKGRTRKRYVGREFREVLRAGPVLGNSSPATSSRKLPKTVELLEVLRYGKGIRRGRAYWRKGYRRGAGDEDGHEVTIDRVEGKKAGVSWKYGRGYSAGGGAATVRVEELAML